MVHNVFWSVCMSVFSLLAWSNFWIEEDELQSFANMFQSFPPSNVLRYLTVCLSVCRLGLFCHMNFSKKEYLHYSNFKTLMWNVQMTSDSHLTSIFKNVFHTLIYARVFIIANTLNLESGIHINFISTWNASGCFLSRESQKKKHGK